MTKKFKLINLDIAQEITPAKVTTDSILLASWVAKENPIFILDVGTGTGILALMMARKYPSSKIRAIDIHKPSVVEAKQNIINNTLQDQIMIDAIPYQALVQQSSEQFDIIISNPPYFTNDQLSLNVEKNNYRHDQFLRLKDLIKGAKKLLSSSGSFYLIMNIKVIDQLEELLHLNGFYLTKLCRLKGREGQKEKLLMCSFQKSFDLCDYSTLNIRNLEGEYTNAYYDLCKFYLKKPDK